jgi:5-formyltetrahydrofolate cyclo-ligase
MKAALRKAYRTLPATCDFAAIVRRVVAADWWPAAFSIGLFSPVPPEPDIRAVYDDAFRLGFRVAFPGSSATGKYTFRFADPDAPWKEGPFGIPEPMKSSPVSHDGLRVILVPGVAFDECGTRLGHGKGIYDRLLARFPSALKIGICGENRIAPVPLPRNPYDQPVDAVFTDRRAIFLPSAAAKLAHLLGTEA